MFKKIVLSLLLTLSIVGIGAESILDVAQGEYSVKTGLELIKKWKNIDGTKLPRGIVYHNIAGVELRLEWIEMGIKLLEQEYNSSGDALALGYLGSIITIRGDYEFNKKNVLAAVISLEDGAEKIDKAIDLDGENISLRFLRVINGIAVSESSPFDRDRVIAIDLEYLNSHIKELEDINIARLYYNQAIFQLNKNSIDDGLNSLEKAVRVDPNSSIGKAAMSLLLEWEE